MNTLQSLLGILLAFGYLAVWNRARAYECPTFQVYLLCAGIKRLLPIPAVGGASHLWGYIWWEPALLFLKAMVCAEILAHLTYQDGLAESWWRWLTLCGAGVVLMAATAQLNYGALPVLRLESYRQIAHVGMAGFLVLGAVSLWAFPLRCIPWLWEWGHAIVWTIYALGFAGPGFIDYLKQPTEALRWRWYYIEAFSVQSVEALCLLMWWQVFRPSPSLGRPRPF